MALQTASCDCCAVSAPDVRLEGSSTSLGFLSTCGWRGFSNGSTTWYATQAISNDWEYSSHSTDCAPPVGDGETHDQSNSCTGGYSLTDSLQMVSGAVTCQQSAPDGDPHHCITDACLVDDLMRANPDYTISEHYSSINGPDSDSSEHDEISVSYTESGLDCGSSTYTCHSKKTTTLSGTMDVMAFLASNLPDYSAWGVDSAPESIKNSQPGSYAINRSKGRVSHQPSPTGYLKVWLQTRETHDSGGSDIVTPLAAYEWTATGNPCVAIADRNTYITGPEIDLGDPSADGTKTLELVAFSCLQDYDPTATSPQGANGFPAAPTGL